MTTTWVRWLFLAAACGTLAMPVAASDAPAGNLVGAGWLRANLARADVVVLDASPAPVYAKAHIPGAVNADWFSFGLEPAAAAAVEQRLRSWGVGHGRKVVVYDRGGDIMATRLFFELYYHGVPPADLFVLDGGLAKWQADGGPVTALPSPAPPRGDFRIAGPREDVRVRLPEFLNGTGDPAGTALVEALDASYHFGEAKFFDRAGHVPRAIMLPAADFYNADKTFKSPAEIARMARHLGIRPGQQVYAHCGGGVAASVPFFALRFLAGYPNVKLYVESQLEWLRDERGLPYWTYDAPYVTRDRTWLAGWSSRMLRTYGVARVSVVDVRAPDAYAQGHVPFALSVPATEFRRHAASPERLAALLGPAGVNADDEAVIVAEGGITPAAALAFVVLEKAGQRKVSILLDSMSDWGLAGLPLATEATVVGPRRTPQDVAVPATVYAPLPRAGVLDAGAPDAAGGYATLVVASGTAVPDRMPTGKVVHIPYTKLLEADGTPKPAKDIWKILADAGVTRYATILCVAADPGEAAANYVLLRLMGFPDVRVVLL